MIKEFIGTGKTVEEATSAAKAGLGAPDSADVKVEIVEMPKKGFLGLGSKPAQVKVSYDDGVKESAPKKKPSKQNAGMRLNGTDGSSKIRLNFPLYEMISQETFL